MLGQHSSKLVNTSGLQPGCTLQLPGTMHWLVKFLKYKYKAGALSPQQRSACQSIKMVVSLERHRGSR